MLYIPGRGGAAYTRTASRAWRNTTIGKGPILSSPPSGRSAHPLDLLRCWLLLDDLSGRKCLAAVIGRMLRHLGLPTDLPVARPARAPPLLAAAGEAQADEYESAP